MSHPSDDDRPQEPSANSGAGNTGGSDAATQAESSGRRPSPTLDRMKQMKEQEERLRRRMAQVKHEILVLSGKGGVGKSTVAANLARALALRDLTVGLLDADIHGPNLPLLLGIEGQRALGSEEGILPVEVGPKLKVMSISFLLPDAEQPVVWRGPLKGGLIKQFLADVEWGPLDFLIVDNPPGTGDEPLTAAQSLPDPDGAIIVSLPQEVSLLDCRKAVNFARALNVPVLGVIENMSGFVCPHCGQQVDIFGTGGAEKMAAQMGVPFLGRIPLAAQAPSLSDAGISLVGPQAPEALRDAFLSVAEKLLDQLEEK